MENNAFEVVKGNPNQVEQRALSAVLAQVVQQARALREEKPDTRGFYGMVSSTVPGAAAETVDRAGADVEPNPGGFRLPEFPVAPARSTEG
ncbi:hypothetical protein [Corynebacterium heidelbergense]|uniref:Uncharacterized protein n=1 Tax=Corynebacterium heidelbergense TaxID=2055947 RepID=A0A364VDT0_9CORY|nr:hypothetical protein [Corynebacterium heidelbergense]RAV34803.1 hypothetical protein CWC39_01315 [Corynebacterium heidelbergense]WCZ37226.1 hypothetical protein CHEID_08480 [Corynebacterium heidelbergense]